MFLIAATMLLQLAAEPAFLERPCADARLAETARCGVVRVLEDRDKPNGRRIDLNVVILSSLAGRRELPPLFDLAGGPGLPATISAGFYLGDGAAYRARRDIVLVDQRGTGGSNPLACPELAAPEGAYAPMLPVEAVIRCRDALESRADLAHYGTRDAVADLEAVRQALGEERIDLFALSYGTTVALRYMHAYPGRVRAAVLMGTAPADTMPPRHHATAGERALTLLYEDCAADMDCRTAFPDPAADLRRALVRLPQLPGAPAPEVFMEKLRALMYMPAGARQVPWIVSRAAEGDLEPFYTGTRPRGPSPIADGMFMAVTCSESFGLMDYDQAAAAARATRFGDYRLRRQRAACAVWPRGAPAPDHLAPVRSDTPVLLISGRLDPVTPPELADAVARHLSNRRHLVIADGGHIIDGLANVDCIDGLILRFLDRDDPQALDAGCLATVQAPRFTTSTAAR